MLIKTSEELLKERVDIFEILNNWIKILKEENKEIKKRSEKLYSNFDVRDISLEEIEKIILQYLKLVYNLDARRVFDICQKLQKESKLLYREK